MKAGPLRKRGVERWTRRSLMLSALSLGACAQTSAPRRPTRIWLLGEVHDHPGGHARRLIVVQELLAQGHRPAMVFEMFDAPQQARLDAARQDGLEAVMTLMPKGWHAPHYRPLVALALQHGLPLVAANVGRDEARQIMRTGLAASGFDAAVPEVLLNTQAGLIEASHCGQVDRTMARRMALAQIARDQRMAAALSAQAERGGVLFAGNGHVRKDIGVPHWLPAPLRERAEVLGFVEAEGPVTAFDRQVSLLKHSRPDTCSALRTAPK